MRSIHSATARATMAVAAGCLALAACSPGGSDDSADISPDDVKAALDKGGSITVWSWDPTLESAVVEFEKKHPNVDVKLVNAGTGNDQYTALQNAIKAGKGVPDLAQVEYFALSQFALADSLEDLTPYGADEIADEFAPGPAAAIRSGEGTYGIPMDSGPMALFYNKEIFDKYDLQVPTTWEQYVQTAKKLRAADPKAYITNDAGDAGFTTSLIWQAGGKPYRTKDTNVTIDFSDAGAQKFASTWQTLIDDELVAPIGSFSDEWFKGLNDGTLATLVIGAWMPPNLESGAPDGKGKWRVAPMPQWEQGGSATAENGGSSMAIPAGAENKALAYAFGEFAGVGDGVTNRVDEGAFPATNEELESPEFQNKSFEYFGGQKANEVFAQSSANVVQGWSYLPFQIYANSIFNDTVGKAYVGGGSLEDGLTAWQKESAAYGTEQGFEVKQ